MARVLNSTSVNVTWEEIPPMNRNGIITTYEILYEPLETFDGMIMSERVNTSSSDLYVVQYIPLETFGDTTGTKMVNTYDLFYLLDNLEEYVNYNITVRAYTSAGPGPYSDSITNQTLQDSKFLYFKSYG